MANPYFQAKVLWEAGQREEGLAILNNFLESQVAQPVFRPHSRIFHADTLASWEAVFVTIFCNSDALVAPFARVFPLIWQMLPSLHTIVMLRNQDFARQPDIPDYLAEIEGLDDFDYQNTYADFVNVAEVLAESARKGILRPSSDEYRGTGVAYLTLDQIKELSHGAWEPLGTLLLTHLPEAYASCPPDFWMQQAADDSVSMVARMLHMTFGEEHPTLKTSQMNLERISVLAPEYYNALLSALSNVLSQKHPDVIEDLVKYDANLPGVTEPRLWLQMLHSSLIKRQFDDFIKETSKYRS